MERPVYYLALLETDPEKRLMRKTLHEISRHMLRLYFAGWLSWGERFDTYPELGENMCQKITTDLNLTLQEGGIVTVIDFPSPLEPTRVQILTQSAYLRVTDPLSSFPVTDQFMSELPISTKLTPQWPVNGSGLNFEVRTNYGQDTIHTVSVKSPKDAFAIVTYHHGAHLLIDSRAVTRTMQLAWKVNSGIFN